MAFLIKKKMQKNQGKLNINDFSYDLPDERIAKFPLQNRDNSKLLFYKGGTISSKVFNELPGLIDNSYELIFNDTKVIQARLYFSKATGSGIEIFLLEPYEPSDYVSSFTSVTETSWICLVGNAKKWKNESLQRSFEIDNNSITVKANKISKVDNAYIIRFSWDKQNISFSRIVLHAGLTPIPPYLKREAQDGDKVRYQTVYSNFEGSVAAPTAGLHFTNEILTQLKSKGIGSIKLTLHVGAGTFIPVKEDDVGLHKMHSEQIFISRDSIENLLKSDKKQIAVGTTSVRTLESLYWAGVKLKYQYPADNILFLDQWECYEFEGDTSRKESLENILAYMSKHKIENLHLTTKIMIVPGYNFKMIKGMITNFHQPKSTLLLLIAAFCGDDWKTIYEYALNNDYRFLSYGDSSLLLR